MMRPLLFIFLISLSCGQNEEKTITSYVAPIVTNEGKTIQFSDKTVMADFQTKQLKGDAMQGAFIAPGEATAVVLGATTGKRIIFSNPELASAYTQLLQSQTGVNNMRQVTIKQKERELERTQDLLDHGAATGQDLLNIQTELANERSLLSVEEAALAEQESILKSSGLQPSKLFSSPANTVYIISDLPENQMGYIQEGEKVEVHFTAFPKEIFEGKIDGIAEVISATNRMVKVRIALSNTDNKIKAGMYAKVSFGLGNEDVVAIDKSALVTVNGKHYVFVKENDSTFIRKEVKIGPQIGESISTYEGLDENDEVVTQGVLQLKGLSFGY